MLDVPLDMDVTNIKMLWCAKTPGFVPVIIIIVNITRKKQADGQTDDNQVVLSDSTYHWLSGWEIRYNRWVDAVDASSALRNTLFLLYSVFRAHFVGL